LLAALLATRTTDFLRVGLLLQLAAFILEPRTHGTTTTPSIEHHHFVATSSTPFACTPILAIARAHNKSLHKAQHVFSTCREFDMLDITSTLCRETSHERVLLGKQLIWLSH
jgi:hypothetical protein